MGGTVVDGNEEGRLKGVWLFGNSIPVNILQFLDYKPPSGNNDEVGCIFLQLARLHAWLATVLTRLKQKEVRGDHRQKAYADTFISETS